jgi:hypothetical protein
MHGLLVKLHMSGNMADYDDALTEYAHALTKRDGFISKTWLGGDEMIGGFYVFGSHATAQSYIDEMLVPPAEQYNALTVQDIQHFSILEGYSSITNAQFSASAPAAAEAALD